MQIGHSSLHKSLCQKLDGLIRREIPHIQCDFKEVLGAICKYKGTRNEGKAHVKYLMLCGISF